MFEKYIKVFFHCDNFGDCFAKISSETKNSYNWELDKTLLENWVTEYCEENHVLPNPQEYAEKFKDFGYTVEILDFEYFEL